MRGRLLKVAYGLRHHEWGGRTLEWWLIAVALVAAAARVLFRLPRGVASIRADIWLEAGLLLLLALAVAILGRWARGQQYVAFEPEPHTPPPPGEALEPADKVLLRATGQFEVEGKAHFWAHLLAYWRTFATREHAVMAIVHKTRFLGVGAMPERDAGMWYIFWCPERIVELMPGQVTFGTERRPALRVTYDTPELSDAERRRLPFWQRRRKISRRETVYLSFDDDATRRQVWSDLLADAPGSQARGTGEITEIER